MSRCAFGSETLRQYLLTGSSGLQDDQFEEWLMVDSYAFEEVEIAEEELIDDYLQGALVESEKEQFLNHFLSSSQRIKKLKVAQALFEYTHNHSDFCKSVEDKNDRRTTIAKIKAMVNELFKFGNDRLEGLFR